MTTVANEVDEGMELYEITRKYGADEIIRRWYGHKALVEALKEAQDWNRADIHGYGVITPTLEMLGNRRKVLSGSSPQGCEMTPTVERVYLGNGWHLAEVTRHRRYATVRTFGRLKGRRIALGSLVTEPVDDKTSQGFLRALEGK